MSDDKRSKEPSKPRLCERCGSRMPPQKRPAASLVLPAVPAIGVRGTPRPRELKDKQPNVNDLSDVVEVMQHRAAQREARRRQVVPDREAPHTSHTCVQTVLADYVLTTFVVEHITDVVRDHGVVNTFNGRILAEAVAELVNAVMEKTAAVVPADACPGINPPRPRHKARRTLHVGTSPRFGGFQAWRPGVPHGRTGRTAIRVASQASTETIHLEESALDPYR